MAWREENNMLTKEWSFEDFVSAWAFAEKCAVLYEKMNHHPDTLVGWGKVKISLTTHDAGNTITDLDRKMAAEIDKL